MPELEELLAHDAAPCDSSELGASVSLEAGANVINVVDFASFEPDVALDASKLQVFITKVIAIR